VRVIVVGAGILGLSVAYNLAARGTEVLVLEQQYPGSGLSERAIGAVHSQWDNKHDIKLAMKSRDLLSQLSGELNFNIGFRRGGYLMVATDEEQLKQLEKNTSLQHSLGVETIFLSSDEIGARYPFLDVSSIVGGTFSRGDGVVHPFSLEFGYWTGLDEQGGKMQKSTTVKSLQVEGRRVLAAETDRGVYKADAFVVAAGAGTGEILQSVGLQLPTQLVRHEMLATEPLRFFLKPMIQVNPKGMYIAQSLRGEILCQIPRTDGQVRKGTNSTLEFLEDAASELTHFLPSLRQAKVLRPWAGLLQTTRDSEPISGRLGNDNLWLAFADSGKGIMFAPAIGELMAESVISGVPSPELLPYTPGRLLV
jgi:sarcosine oxidase subunit beta